MRINIPYLHTDHPCADQVMPLLDAAGIEFQLLSQANWADTYPYHPEVKFRMAHTGQYLLIHYQVAEETVRAIAETDNARVWEDSCCEFFISPAQNEQYYNLEVNCTGKALLNFGIVGQRQRATEATLASIDRWSSLGKGIFDNRPAPAEWNLCLVLPIGALYAHQYSSWSGLQVKANVYKCGDLLPKPHFLSLTRIELPKPCFHCPEWFADFVFENPAN